jgi:hypothetical protein
MGRAIRSGAGNITPPTGTFIGLVRWVRDRGDWQAESVEGVLLFRDDARWRVVVGGEEREFSWPEWDIYRP